MGPGVYKVCGVAVRREPGERSELDMSANASGVGTADWLQAVKVERRGGFGSPWPGNRCEGGMEECSKRGEAKHTSLQRESSRQLSYQS